MRIRTFLKNNLLAVTIGGFAFVACIVFLSAVFSSPLPEPADGRLEAAFAARTNSAPPAACIVRKDETIFAVARRLGIPFYDLVIENRLTGELPLSEGQVLKIPRFSAGAAAPSVRPRVAIRTERPAGIAPHAAQLVSDFPFTDPGLRFVWDLGNNRYSFKARPDVLYVHPGRYRTRFITVDQSGAYAASNALTIAVADLQAEYQGLPYLTLDRVDDLLDVSGRLRSVDGAPVDFDQAGELTQSAPLLEYFGRNLLIARRPGFSRVKLEENGRAFEFYLFVSPLPARLAAEPEYDWYKTQFNTGMYGNCGPAAIDSAIKWATGEDFSVEEIRAEIGMPYHDGAVDHDNLLENLTLHDVPAAILPVERAADIMEVIDRGGLAIVSFNCGAVRPTDLDKTTNFFDRYYPDATGHYLLIKGYSLDRKYFIVYDAIPGDWNDNGPRYLDGVSMTGRNRFFLIDEVMAGIGTKKMLAVTRNFNKKGAVR
jgi:hypothetical protein